MARWADRCLLMRDGRLLADGKATTVLSPERIGEVYELEPEDRLAFASGIGSGIAPGRAPEEPGNATRR